MDHVVGARHAADRNAGPGARRGYFFALGRRDRFGHGGAAQHRHVELDDIITGVARGLESRERVRCGKGLGENADLHQT